MNSSIIVDEEEPLIDVEAPFESRNIQIQRQRWVTEDFTVLDFLGRGKFGEVKRCRENTTAREFAAKFISAPRPGDKAEVEHEVKIMKKLQHKRILQLYDCYQSAGEMCIVLEIIYGGELFDRVIDEDFILTEKACIVFMRQICEGVDYMHNHGVLHLDMKPENILCLSRTGNRIKIIDFGLAREYDGHEDMRILFGTPEFMAPEVVHYERIGYGTDMWSVGVICYVLLSGLSPFMGDTDSDTINNVVTGVYDFDFEEFSSVSDNAKDLIAKLLVKNEKNRLRASECLEHPWLQRRPSESPTLQLSKRRLKKFVYRRKWQKIYNAMIALKRMGINLSTLQNRGKLPVTQTPPIFHFNSITTPSPSATSPQLPCTTTLNITPTAPKDKPIELSPVHGGDLTLAVGSPHTTEATSQSMVSDVQKRNDQNSNDQTSMAGLSSERRDSFLTTHAEFTLQPPPQKYNSQSTDDHNAPLFHSCTETEIVQADVSTEVSYTFTLSNGLDDSSDDDEYEMPMAMLHIDEDNTEQSDSHTTTAHFTLSNFSSTSDQTTDL